jgi:SAM-dependent methyltransferase
MDQKTRWNTVGGNAWVELQALTDQSLAPLIPPLLEGIDGTVLDVGCGTGATTVAAAERAERAVGIDISEPMIAAARARGGDAEFLVADAQTYAFAENAFDHVISRFGVMFFDDPVTAFTNLRHAGRALRCIAWRSAEENPFHTAAARAPHGLELPPREPDAPGQFAFADAGRVRGILSAAGWTDVNLQPLDVESTLPAAQLETYFTRLGPVGNALQEADDATRIRVIEAVRPAFEPFVDGDTVRYTAACWLITAHQ